MDKEDKPGKRQREITYQIGRKKGKIQWDDLQEIAIVDNQDKLPASKLYKLHTCLIWREIPAVPASWLFPLLYLLPALIFLLTVVLVHNLTHP